MFLIISAIICTFDICKAFFQRAISVVIFLNFRFICVGCYEAIVIENHSFSPVLISVASIFLIDLFRISCPHGMYITTRNFAENSMVFGFFHYIYNKSNIFRSANNFRNATSSALSVIHSNKILPVFFNQCSTSQSCNFSSAKTCAKTESFKFRSIMVCLCRTTSGDIFSFSCRCCNKVC